MTPPILLRKLRACYLEGIWTICSKEPICLYEPSGRIEQVKYRDCDRQSSHWFVTYRFYFSVAITVRCLPGRQIF